jgi:hypothetical protein
MRKRGTLFALSSLVVTSVHVLTVVGTAYADGPQPVPIAAPPPLPVGTAPTGTAPTAPQTGPDAVYLKDGGMIRGTIIEVIPGNHASVQLADGRIATIRWDMVDHIDRGTAAKPPVTTPPPAALPPAATPPPAASMVMVHIDADADVILEQQVAGGRWAGGEWRDVCQAPCDMSLPTNTMYRVGGPGVKSSRPFSIEASGGKAVLDVHGASSGAFAGGIVLVSLGPLAILVGSLVALVGAAENASDCSFVSSSCSSSRGDGLVAGGLVTLGIGVAATVIGGVLIGTNSRTKVGQPLAGVAKLSEKDILKTLGPTTRIPTWNTSLERTPPPSTPMVIPFYSGTF